MALGSIQTKDIMIRKYETTNDRGMEEMSEMWKDRKPDESRAQPLMRNGIVQMGTLDIAFPGSIFLIFTIAMTPSLWKVSLLICAIISPLARRSRCFPRKLENLQDVLAVFVWAYNRFGFQKHRYRSRHPGSSVPFSLFDFL